MGKGKLTDDYLKWILDIDGNPAAKSLNDLSTKSNDLRNANKALNGEMQKLAARGKENTAEYKKLDTQFKQNNLTIAQTEKKMADLRKEVGLNGLSLKELKRYLADTKRAYELATPNTAEHKKLYAELQAGKARFNELNGAATKTNGVFGTLKASTMLFYGAIMATVGAVGGFVMSIINTYGEFEKYKAVLTNAYGSTEIATQKMSMLQDVAAQLPISLREATESFIKMKNSGMEPTRDMMISLTDMASSQGKGLDQYVEALKDAKMGEYERLKEFSIKARADGDKVSFTFKNQTTVVQKNEEAIEKYLLSLGKLPGIAGSSAAVMNTLQGKISNLGDSWDRMLVAMGEGGFGSAAKSVIGFLGGMVDGFTEMISSPTSQKLEEERGKANALAIQLMNTNLKSEDRNRIYGELQRIAPKIVEGIDAENISTKKLADNLRIYNDEMVNKIILQQKQEEIDDQAKVTAEQKMAFIKSQTELSKQLYEVQKVIASQNGEAGKEAQRILELDMSIGAKAQSLQKIAKETGLVYGPLNYAVGTYYNNLKYASVEEIKGNKLLREKIELMTQLGVSSDTAVDPNTGKTPKNDISDAEKKRSKEILEARTKLAADIAALESKANIDSLLKRQQEVAIIEGKYEDLINKVGELYNIDDVNQRAEANQKVIQLEDAKNQEIFNLNVKWNEEDAKEEQKKWEEDEKKRLENNKLQAEYLQKRNDIRKEYELMSSDELRQLELDNIQSLYDKKLLTTEEYARLWSDTLEKYRQMDAKKQEALWAQELSKLKDNLAMMQAAYDQFSTIVNNIAQAEAIDIESSYQQQTAVFNDEANKRKAKLEADYNDKLAAAKGNEDLIKAIKEQYALDSQNLETKVGNEKAKMDKKFADEKVANEKRYAGLQLFAAIGKIASEAASGIMAAWGAFGWNPLTTWIAVAQSALIGGVALTQGALAKSQYNAVMNQRAAGKYSVIGADDGKTYNAEYTSRLSSGLVSRPTLVAEEPEIVMSIKDTRFAMMNYPQILRDIQYIRHGIVPQRADGNYKSMGSEQTIQTSGIDNELKMLIANNTSVMSYLLKEGVFIIWADKDTEQLTKRQQVISDIQTAANRYT